MLFTGAGGRKGWRARLSRDGALDAAGEAVEAVGLMERWELWGGVPERGQSVKQEDRSHSSAQGWERGSYGGAGREP